MPKALPPLLGQAPEGGGSGASPASPAEVAQSQSPLGSTIGDINEALGFDRAHGFAGQGVTDSRDWRSLRAGGSGIGF
jgi:hypothetical protein